MSEFNKLTKEEISELDCQIARVIGKEIALCDLEQWMCDHHIFVKRIDQLTKEEQDGLGAQYDRACNRDITEDDLEQWMLVHRIFPDPIIFNALSSHFGQTPDEGGRVWMV